MGLDGDPVVVGAMASTSKPAPRTTSVSGSGSHRANRRPAKSSSASSVELGVAPLHGEHDRRVERARLLELRRARAAAASAGRGGSSPGPSRRRATPVRNGRCLEVGRGRRQRVAARSHRRARASRCVASSATSGWPRTGRYAPWPHPRSAADRAGRRPGPRTPRASADEPGRPAGRPLGGPGFVDGDGVGRSMARMIPRWTVSTSHSRLPSSCSAPPATSRPGSSTPPSPRSPARRQLPRRFARRRRGPHRDGRRRARRPGPQGDRAKPGKSPEEVAAFDELDMCVRYVAGDADDPETYERLGDRARRVRQRHGTVGQPPLLPLDHPAAVPGDRRRASARRGWPRSRRARSAGS